MNLKRILKFWQAINSDHAHGRTAKALINQKIYEKTRESSFKILGYAAQTVLRDSSGIYPVWRRTDFSQIKKSVLWARFKVCIKSYLDFYFSVCYFLKWRYLRSIFNSRFWNWSQDNKIRKRFEYFKGENLRNFL